MSFDRELPPLSESTERELREEQLEKYLAWKRREDDKQERFEQLENNFGGYLGY